MSESKWRWLPLFAVKLLISAALLAWLLIRPGMENFPALVASADLRWLAPAILCGALNVIFCAWRWHVCLRGVAIALPFHQTARISLAANAAGYFSIGTLGNDATRLLLVARATTGGSLPAAASLAMDHAASIPAMLVLLAAALVPLGLAPTLNPGTTPLLLLSFAAIVAAIVIVRLKWKTMHARILAFLRAGATWRVMAIAAALSFPVWFCFAGIFYCAARALGHDLPALSFAGICAIADAVASLPISIAGLGVREKAFQSLLEMSHGVPAAGGVAISLLGFGILLLWAAIGALCLLAQWPTRGKTME
ncbi:MAG: lysylphosphatidylglycerol synthase transmembrane domain-containing protein [Verrucomicrobiales bacterium]